MPKTEFSESKIHKSEPESRSGNVKILSSFYSLGEIFESVARSVLTANKDAIANACLYVCFQFRIMCVHISFHA